MIRRPDGDLVVAAAVSVDVATRERRAEGAGAGALRHRAQLRREDAHRARVGVAHGELDEAVVVDVGHPGESVAADAVEHRGGVKAAAARRRA